MKTKVTIFIFLIFSLISCKQEKSEALKFPILTGDYLGQPLPGEEPTLFAPGIISTGMYERDFTITSDGDEIYYALASGQVTTIMVTKRVNNVWTEPEIASFADEVDYLYFEPYLHPDNSRIFFLSNRPPEGKGPLPGWGHQNIWVADRQNDGSWSEPYNLGEPICTDDNEYFPSLTNDGTLYFTRSKKGTREAEIFYSKLKDGIYLEPEKLPEIINGNGTLYNAAISPDESYLIACVNGRQDDPTPGTADYCVYFRNEDNQWSQSIDINGLLNISGIGAVSPSITPDGSYFFFAAIINLRDSIFSHNRMTFSTIEKLYNSPQNGRSDIYWVSTNIIKELGK